MQLLRLLLLLSISCRLPAAFRAQLPAILLLLLLLLATVAVCRRPSAVASGCCCCSCPPVDRLVWPAAVTLTAAHPALTTLAGALLLQTAKCGCTRAKRGTRIC
jgi:hypothetical protein